MVYLDSEIKAQVAYRSTQLSQPMSRWVVESIVSRLDAEDLADAEVLDAAAEAELDGRRE